MADIAEPRRPFAQTLLLLGLLLLAIGASFACERLVASKIERHATDGVEVTVVVTRLSGTSREPIAHFMAGPENARTEVSAKVSPPAPRPGRSLVGTALPDDPTDVRLLSSDEGAIGEATAPFRGMRFILVLVAGLAVVLRHGERLVRPGVAMGGLFLLLLLWVSTMPEVVEVQIAAFGETLLGLHTPWVVMGAQAVLLGPALLVFGDSVFELNRARPQGTVGGVAGLISLMVNPGEGAVARRHRLRLALSAGWLGAAMVAWIVYASAVGV